MQGVKNDFTKWSIYRKQTLFRRGIEASITGERSQKFQVSIALMGPTKHV